MRNSPNPLRQYPRRAFVLNPPASHRFCGCPCYKSLYTSYVSSLDLVRGFQFYLRCCGLVHVRFQSQLQFVICNVGCLFKKDLPVLLVFYIEFEFVLSIPNLKHVLQVSYISLCVCCLSFAPFSPRSPGFACLIILISASVSSMDPQLQFVLL